MFVRVRVRATGHQIDVHESVFDPDRHVRVRGWRKSAVPRRSKYMIRPRLRRDGEKQ